MPFINSDGYFEQEYNFREFEAIFATKSKHVLTAKDLTPDDIVQYLAMIGQYAEIAHSSLSVPFVLNNIATLSRPGFPLESYDALHHVEHIRSIHSTIGEHQGYCAILPREQSVLLAFSGTAHISVAFRLMWIWKERFVNKTVPRKVRLHAGFQKVYAAAPRTHARDALTAAFKKQGVVDTFVITGHSLGGTMAQFMLLEILEDVLSTPAGDERLPWQTNPPNITLATFGSPRPGNKSFKKYYAKRIEEYREKTGKRLIHYSVLGHRDGVPAVPPGFHSVSSVGTTCYLYHGDLYNVPPKEAKHSIFKVIRDESRPARFEHGGHNYYSARDMERLIRRMRAIREDVDAGVSADEWPRRYIKREEDLQAASLKKSAKKAKTSTGKSSPPALSTTGHAPTNGKVEEKDQTTDGQTSVNPPPSEAPPVKTITVEPAGATHPSSSPEVNEAARADSAEVASTSHPAVDTTSAVELEALPTTAGGMGGITLHNGNGLPE